MDPTGCNMCLRIVCIMQPYTQTDREQRTTPLSAPNAADTREKLTRALSRETLGKTFRRCFFAIAPRAVATSTLSATVHGRPSRVDTSGILARRIRSPAAMKRQIFEGDGQLCEKVL